MDLLISLIPLFGGMTTGVLLMSVGTTLRSCRIGSQNLAISGRTLFIIGITMAAMLLGITYYY